VAPAGRLRCTVETFTFLFTDIEGSTATLGRLGEGRYGQGLSDHHALVRSGLSAHEDREVNTQGDAFFAVFSSPRACAAAVVEIQRVLAAHAWPAGEHVRARGVHTGEASRTAAGLVGLDVSMGPPGWPPSGMAVRSCSRSRRRPWCGTFSRPARPWPISVCTGSRTWGARSAFSS
jgi:hypothetical protein